MKYELLIYDQWNDIQISPNLKAELHIFFLLLLINFWKYSHWISKKKKRKKGQAFSPSGNRTPDHWLRRKARWPLSHARYVWPLNKCSANFNTYPGVLIDRSSIDKHRGVFGGKMCSNCHKNRGCGQKNQNALALLWPLPNAANCKLFCLPPKRQLSIDVYTRLKKIKRGYKQLKGTKRFRHVCHHQG